MNAGRYNNQLAAGKQAVGLAELGLRRVADGSELLIPEGTVYPLLARLKAEGWVDSEWVEAEAGHPRKYYSLTRAGRRHLVQMARTWSSFAASVDSMLVPIRKEEK